MSVARNRHQERSERSTARLLDAAAELIEEGGYEAMTLAAIGERAGYSRGLVTARFGSKDQLLAALVDRITTGWSHRNLLPRTVGCPGADGVLILIDAIRVQARRDPRALKTLYALMFEALGPNEALRRRFVEFHRTMRSDVAKLVRRGIRDGSVDPRLDPAEEAVLVVAGLRGIAYQWRLDPVGFDPVPALAAFGRATEHRLRAAVPGTLEERTRR
ncbi:MAG TPA: TetR/AcrR family transcriptional regulator [Acidimicrobiales bacterium]|nr:TetR/AcrR family transcriptional regulator [Acidimicrobiales bacterium]